MLGADAVDIDRGGHFALTILSPILVENNDESVLAANWKRGIPRGGSLAVFTRKKRHALE